MCGANERARGIIKHNTREYASRTDRFVAKLLRRRIEREYKKKHSNLSLSIGNTNTADLIALKFLVSHSLTDGDRGGGSSFLRNLAYMYAMIIIITRGIVEECERTTGERGNIGRQRPIVRHLDTYFCIVGFSVSRSAA